MEKVKSSLLFALQQMIHLIGHSPLWLVALFGLGLRLLVVRPLGPFLALCTGCIWCWRNRNYIGWRFHKLYSRFNTWANNGEKSSFWFDDEGRDKIIELIDWLSVQGVSYCNLADEMVLPPKSHWYAISRGLNELNVLTQISGDAFYITWRLPQRKTNKPEAA